MGSPRSKPGRSRLVADPFDPKIETVEKAVELSIPGVASPGGAGYDFLRQSIANRLAWRTNGLGAHPAKLLGSVPAHRRVSRQDFCAVRSPAIFADCDHDGCRQICNPAS